MKRKDILLYLSTFIIFFVSTVFLLVAFSVQREPSYFIICIVLFIIFCILNKITSKRITFEDGYTAIQAYTFYRRCVKNGISKKPEKLTRSDVDKIKALAEAYDYSEKFTSEQVRKLYCNGYKIENKRG